MLTTAFVVHNTHFMSISRSIISVEPDMHICEMLNYNSFITDTCSISQAQSKNARAHKMVSHNAIETCT